MSKEQLVEAYLRGDLSRRQFVRRLVAAGVSMTAALAYAEMNPQLAHADPGRGRGRGRDHYDHYRDDDDHRDHHDRDRDHRDHRDRDDDHRDRDRRDHDYDD